MNKRGVVIIFSLIVVTILSGFLAVTLFQAMTETRLVRRQVDSVSALWLAEAGISHVMSQTGAPVSVPLTYIANPSDPQGLYGYSVSVSPMSVSGYYTVDATGTVATTGSAAVRSSRPVSTTIQYTPADPSQFAFALATTSTDIDYKTNNITDDSVDKGSDKTFLGLFKISQVAMEAKATTPDFDHPISGINWANVPGGTVLNISNLNGTGILIVNGDFKITGGGTFNGILYVIGSLQSLGNSEINGTIFIDNTASMDKVIWGSSQATYNAGYIATSLSVLSSKTIKSWKEN